MAPLFSLKGCGYNWPIRVLIESLTHQPLATANEGIQGITASITKFDFWMWLCQLGALVRVLRKCDRMREESHVPVVWLWAVYTQEKLLRGICSHGAAQSRSWGSPYIWRQKEHSRPAVFSISTHLPPVNLPPSYLWSSLIPLAKTVSKFPIIHILSVTKSLEFQLLSMFCLHPFLSSHLLFH